MTWRKGIGILLISILIGIIVSQILYLYFNLPASDCMLWSTGSTILLFLILLGTMRKPSPNPPPTPTTPTTPTTPAPTTTPATKPPAKDQMTWKGIFYFIIASIVFCFMLVVGTILILGTLEKTVDYFSGNTLTAPNQPSAKVAEPIETKPEATIAEPSLPETEFKKTEEDTFSGWLIPDKTYSMFHVMRGDRVEVSADKALQTRIKLGNNPFHQLNPADHTRTLEMPQNGDYQVRAEERVFATFKKTDYSPTPEESLGDQVFRIKLKPGEIHTVTRVKPGNNFNIYFNKPVDFRVQFNEQSAFTNLTGDQSGMNWDVHTNGLLQIRSDAAATVSIFLR